MTDTLVFDAIVYKVQTLVDNGLRVTLDLPEQAITEAAVLMALKREGVAITVTVDEANCKTRENNAIPKGTKRQSKWSATQEQGAN